MVHVDVPGLAKDLDIKYRPPRISLFPPSYRERAYLRSVHREILRQSGATAQPSAGDKTKNNKLVTFSLGSSKRPDKAAKATQTTETHCYHECSLHPHEGKKSDDQKGTKKPDSNDKSDKKKDSKGGDGDWSDSKDKGTDTNDKNKNDKSKTDNKKDESKFKIPDPLKPFLPYPFTSTNADIFWANSSFQKPFPERPFVHREDPTSWSLDYKIEAARRADEKIMWNWLSNQEGHYRKGAFQWLAERDTERQAKLAQASHALTSLSLDPSIGRIPAGFETGYQGAQFGPAFGGNSSSLQAYVDPQGNIRLGDGTMVTVTGQSANNQAQTGLCNVYQRPVIAPLDQGYNGGHLGAFSQYNHRPQWYQGQMWPNQQPAFQNTLGYQTNGPFQAQNLQYQHQGINPSQISKAQCNVHSTQRNNQASGNNNGWGPNGNAAQNNNAWNSSQNNGGYGGPSNTQQDNNGWGANPNSNDTGGVQSGWGAENDENIKPNDFFDPVPNTDNNQGNSGQQHSNDIGLNDPGGDDMQNHPFFSGGGGGASNSPAAGQTMSGAKGTGRRDYGEPINW